LPAGWARLRKIEGNRLFLSFRNGDLEIQEPSQWWRQHLEQIKHCLEKGQILAYFESNRIDRLVLQDSAGSRTTLYRPWRLW